MTRVDSAWSTVDVADVGCTDIACDEYSFELTGCELCADWYGGEAHAH